MDGQRDRRAHGENACDEHHTLESHDVERVAHEGQPAEEEADGDDKGKDVHALILPG